MRVLHGDCLQEMRRLADEGVLVDSVVTDPPYHLTSIVKRFGSETAAPAKGGVYARSSKGFMGKTWDGGDIAMRPETWELAAALMKPGAHLVAFGGSRTFHRVACAIEDAGLEIRDTIMWLYGSGFPKSHDVSKGIDRATGADREVVGVAGRSGSSRSCMAGDFTGGEYMKTAPATDAARQWEGWGTALKPAHEPVILARKPLDGTVAANVLKHGTGAINIRACRVPSSTGQRPSGDEIWAREQSLCGSCAERVERNGKHPTPAIAASTATKPVAPTMSAKAETSLLDIDRTVIGCSDGMMADNTVINSSIDGSGKTPTDQFSPDMTSIMSTATRATTGSKTCSACGDTITLSTIGSTIREKKNSQQEHDSSANAQLDAGARWPANLVHDGSPEVLEAFARFGERPGKGGHISHRTAPKSKHTFGDLGCPEEGRIGFPDTGTAARFFYAAKASAADRAGSKHPTVKPLSLMRWLCRLVTPPGGLVLDPFAGSGTTLQAAYEEGFRAIGIEREAEYVADIHRRMERAEPRQPDIFAGAA